MLPQRRKAEALQNKKDQKREHRGKADAIQNKKDQKGRIWDNTLRNGRGHIKHKRVRVGRIRDNT